MRKLAAANQNNTKATLAEQRQISEIDAKLKEGEDCRLFNFAIIGGLPCASSLDRQKDVAFYRNHSKAEILQIPAAIMLHGGAEVAIANILVSQDVAGILSS